jgi:hypothetical protein
MAGCNRRKNRAKAHDIGKKVVEMMAHGVSMLDEKVRKG